MEEFETGFAEIESVLNNLGNDPTIPGIKNFLKVIYDARDTIIDIKAITMRKLSQVPSNITERTVRKKKLCRIELVRETNNIELVCHVAWVEPFYHHVQLLKLMSIEDPEERRETFKKAYDFFMNFRDYILKNIPTKD